MRTLTCTVAAAALLLAAPVALAHQGNPNYRSIVNSVTPAASGVDVTVLNFDDRLLLHNTSGQDIVIYDYDNLPYAEVLANGTVRVNTNSEAYYLNEDRLGETTVPKDLGAEPEWKELSKSARFEWHDHRAHWMGEGDPPFQTDKSVEQKLYDWTIPIKVGEEHGEIAGTLRWVPLDEGSIPLPAIIGLGALIVALAAAVIVIRRRRRGDDGSGGEAESAPPKEVVEAW